MCIHILVTMCILFFIMSILLHTLPCKDMSSVQLCYIMQYAMYESVACCMFLYMHLIIIATLLSLICHCVYV